MTEQKAIPLSIPDLRGREAEYLAQCVSDNWVSSAGPFVTELETRIAELSGRRYGIATVNGTAALHLALLGADIAKGTRVIVPDWTFAASANAIYQADLEPYFVDVSATDWTLDPALVERVIADPESRVGAIMPVHVLGRIAEMDALAEIAGELPIIEDAAGAIGARRQGRPAGNFGTFAAFSFNGNKTVTAGGGGMVVTDDAVGAERIRHLSTQSRIGAAYIHDAIGFNYRMTNLNAAVGLAQFERLDEMVESRKRIASNYDNAFSDRDDLVPMPRRGMDDSSCWLYSVRTASGADAQSLIEALGAAKIEARTFWESLSGQTPYAEAPNLLQGVSNALSGTVVSLPSSSQLAKEEQARVLSVISNWRGASVPLETQ